MSSYPFVIIVTRMVTLVKLIINFMNTQQSVQTPYLISHKLPHLYLHHVPSLTQDQYTRLLALITSSLDIENDTLKVNLTCNSFFNLFMV